MKSPCCQAKVIRAPDLDGFMCASCCKSCPTPPLQNISVWCAACENVYALPELPGVPLQDRRCPYGHAGLTRGWIARIVEGLR